MERLNRDQLMCLNPDCPEYGKLGAGNIGIHSYHDKRYYCTTCKGRWTATDGTIFYSLKTDQKTVLLALAMLAERNSISAVARILSKKRDTISRWLVKAAQHSEAVSDLLIRDVKVSHVQLDELWSFVKKKTRSGTSRTQHRTGATSGSGIASTQPAGSGSPTTSPREER